VSVNQVEPDLEDVFLHLVHSGDEAEASGTAAERER
jgi:hypothetical protein